MWASSKIFSLCSVGLFMEKLKVWKQIKKNMRGLKLETFFKKIYIQA
jgi:hypothetical protein